MQLLEVGVEALDRPFTPHLVTVNENGDVAVEDFETLEQLVERLKEIHGTDTYAIPFIGRPLPITPGERHFLVVDSETRIPLFDTAVDEEQAVAWHMGDTPNPEHAEPAEVDDDEEYMDEFDEDDDEDLDDEPEDTQDDMNPDLDGDDEEDDEDA